MAFDRPSIHRCTHSTLMQDLLGCAQPFSQVNFTARIWICPFCYQRNHFPPHYVGISETNLAAKLYPQYTTPQGDYIDLYRKRYGYHPNHFERKCKKEARGVHKHSTTAQNALGNKGKMFAKKRYAEKALMKKTLAMYEESSTRCKVDDDVHDEAIPAYLLDRDNTTRAKVLSNTIKQKRKEKARKWEVPLPKVRHVAENEMFKVLRTGKRKIRVNSKVAPYFRIIKICGKQDG